MPEQDWLAQRFEAQRPRMRAVAYRMLGSLSEADDAIQDAWLRVSRAGAEGVDNFEAWLTTVVARVALNMLRSRRTRREVPMETQLPEPILDRPGTIDPEHEALLADSVGLAMLVVLETLSPPERLAFVLHDMFGMPFSQIAPMVDRSPAAARQLASRARRRVRTTAPSPDADPGTQRRVMDAFLTAARAGDLAALVEVLDPEVVLRVDTPHGTREARGAQEVAGRAVSFSVHGVTVHRATVNGLPGGLTVKDGRVLSLGSGIVRGGRIVFLHIVADPSRLAHLDLSRL
ncbi:MAG: sigma-70 family RNA polymerase sigma factor [Candidatus Dormibacteria bacterium]